MKDFIEVIISYEVIEGYINQRIELMKLLSL